MLDREAGGDPGVGAALDVVEVGEAERGGELAGDGGALALGADEHDRFVLAAGDLLEFVGAGHDGHVRHQWGAGGVAILVLVQFAGVDQGYAGLSLLFRLLHGDSLKRFLLRHRGTSRLGSVCPVAHRITASGGGQATREQTRSRNKSGREREGGYNDAFVRRERDPSAFGSSPCEGERRR